MTPRAKLYLPGQFICLEQGHFEWGCDCVEYGGKRYDGVRALINYLEDRPVRTISDVMRENHQPKLMVELKELRAKVAKAEQGGTPEPDQLDPRIWRIVLQQRDILWNCLHVWEEKNGRGYWNGKDAIKITCPKDFSETLEAVRDLDRRIESIERGIE